MGTILYICSSITIIIICFSWLVKCIQPIIKEAHKIKMLEEESIENKKERKIIYKGLLAILHHLESGNSTGEMRKTALELESHLIEK